MALEENAAKLRREQEEQLEEAHRAQEERHGCLVITPSTVPQLGSCTASARAWRLWAARHSQEEAEPLGAQPLLLGLELAASGAADLTAFDYPGAG